MSGTTEATYESAAKATRKTRRFAQRLRDSAARARRAASAKINKVVKATGRVTRRAAGKTACGVTYSVGYIGGLAWLGLRAVCRTVWALLSLVWTLVSTVISLTARVIAWALSVVAGLVFRVGVAFAIISMIFGSKIEQPESVQAEPVKTEYVMTADDLPAPDHRAEFVREDLQPEDLIEEARRATAAALKAQYNAAKTAGDLVATSYLFGRHQAAESKLSKVTSARGWALVAKELKNPGTTLIRKDVKRGWDEEYGEAPRLTAVK